MVRHGCVLLEAGGFAEQLDKAYSARGMTIWKWKMALMGRPIRNTAG